MENEKTSTIEAIRHIINPSLCSSAIYDEYIQRLSEGRPTRDENPGSHFCVYFLSYNQANQTVFIIHHKKSGLWLTTGGHIDKGELPLEALEREMK